MTGYRANEEDITCVDLLLRDKHPVNAESLYFWAIFISAPWGRLQLPSLMERNKNNDSQRFSETTNQCQISQSWVIFVVLSLFVTLLFLFPHLKLLLRRWGMSCIFAISDWRIFINLQYLPGSRLCLLLCLMYVCFYHFWIYKNHYLSVCCFSQKQENNKRVDKMLSSVSASPLLCLSV